VPIDPVFRSYPRIGTLYTDKREIVTVHRDGDKIPKSRRERLAANQTCLHTSGFGL
jgi:hypothetical protein